MASMQYSFGFGSLFSICHIRRERAGMCDLDAVRYDAGTSGRSDHKGFDGSVG